MSTRDRKKNDQQYEEEEDKDWLYLRLEIVPDPIVHQDESKLKEYEQVDVDLITWRTIIMTSLNRMYGMTGESSPFDIPVKLSLKSIVLKIQTEDEEKFNNSFLSYTFNLNKYTDMDVNAYIKILKKGHHVGLVVGT